MEARAVLFDLDGTLIDSLPGIEFSVDCALSACGLPPRSRGLRPLIGPPIRAILHQLVPDACDGQLSQLEQAFRSSYDADGWSKTVLHDGALPTLARLKSSGLPLFLVTNKPAAPTRLIVDNFKLASLFDEVVCRDSRTPAYDSKADMLRDVMKRHGLKPAECLYVGDTLEDHRAAQETGIQVAIIAHGYGENLPRDATRNRVDVTCLNELLTLIEVLEMS
jgi:phosphoglycolate phosphatase